MPPNSSHIGVLSMPLNAPKFYDHRDGAWTMWLFGGFGTIYVLLALIQSYFLTVQTPESNIHGSFWLRMAAALIPLWVAATSVRVFQVWRIQATRQRFAAGIAIVFGAAAARAGLQMLFGIYVIPDVYTISFELLAGMGMFGVALTMAVFVVRRLEGERILMLHFQRARHEALEAIEALHHEEFRIHQEVSEGLHGTVQQRFVLMEARIESILSQQQVDDGLEGSMRSQLEGIREELVTMRDDTIRATSRLLSPDGLELGIRPAVRIILGRLPSTISHEFDVDEATKTLDDLVQPGLSQSQRLVCVRFVEETVTNALKHGHARRISIVMRTTEVGSSDDVDETERGRQLLISVINDGEPWQGPDDGRGLGHVRRRAGVAGGTITRAVVTRDGERGLTSVQLCLPLAGNAYELSSTGDEQTALGRQ